LGTRSLNIGLSPLNAWIAAKRKVDGGGQGDLGVRAWRGGEKKRERKSSQPGETTKQRADRRLTIWRMQEHGF
jgi:hypothetical protein